MGLWRRVLDLVASLFGGDTKRASATIATRSVEPAAPVSSPAPVPAATVAPSSETSPAAPATKLLDDASVAKFFEGFGTETKPWRRTDWEQGRADPPHAAGRSVADAFDRAVWDPVTPMGATLTAANEAATAQDTAHAERQRAQIGDATVSGFFSPAKWQG